MSTSDPIELELPDGVTEARQAVELVRAWVCDGALMVSLNAEAFDDRIENWGRLLGEIGQHVARAAALRGATAEHEALQAIRAGFDATIIQHQPAMSGKIRARTSH